MPVYILYVLALAGALDSPSYATRERAQAAMEAVPPVYSWPAVYWLTRSQSPEVSERANRWLAKWEGMFMAQLLDYAVTAPIYEKPWRKIEATERKNKDPWAFRERWGPLFAERLKAEFPGLRAYMYKYTFWWDPFDYGQLGVMVFGIRSFAERHVARLDFGDW